MLLPVDENTLPIYLQQARPYIERCLKHSPIPHTFEDVVEVLYRNNYKLFMQLNQSGKVRGCAIVSIERQLGTEVMNIFLMSYDSDYTEEDADYEVLVHIAENLGIKYLTYYGRRGFVQRNTPKGWKVSQVVMTKEI